MNKEVHNDITIALTVLLMGYLLAVTKMYTNDSATGLAIQDTQISEIIPFKSMVFLSVGVIIFLALIVNSSIYQWNISLEREVDAKTRQLLDARNRIQEDNAGLRKLNRELIMTKRQLVGKIEELEVFNRLAVGRELKMKELKKMIRKLKDNFNILDNNGLLT